MVLPYLEEAIKNLFKRPATRVSFPKEIPPAAPDYRGRISYDPTLCVNSGMCMRVCAPAAITKTVERNEDGDDVITLSFDLGSCTYCRTCADFCARKAIKLTEDYVMVATNPADLIVSGTFVKKKPVIPPKPPVQPLPKAEA